MMKRTIRKWFILAIVIFIALLITGILISIFDNTPQRSVYSTFTGLMPLILGIAAVWLGYCVQRRNAYQQQLRSLWSNLIEAVHSAICYTRIEHPIEEQYLTTLIKLSTAIDEIRGVFCNLGENNSKVGLYPFEPIKNIYLLIENLSFGDRHKSCDSEKCHEQIFALWKDVRKEILKEFDREEPSFSHSHWKDLSQSRVYEMHGIKKQAT
ncbi:MAG: hypothetical protein JW849_05205 [Phycisphaerae bacterium]|nr:hypothetical protein [Phycisphaerae bacterium]